jgi:uncharacterized protein YegP (UPF0339 family)
VAARKRNPRPKFEIFRARNREFGWRVTSANGRKQATAGETFTRRQDARRAFTRARAAMAAAIER